MCFDQADHKKGKRYNREALALFRELGDDTGSAWALAFGGVQALASPAECKEGIILLEEALALFRKLDYKPGITQTLIGLGEVARLDGDRVRAARACEECRAIAREEGDRMSEAKALGDLSYVAQQKREYARAAGLVTGALTLFRELGARRYICQDFARLAGPVAAQGYPRAAARLLGASEALLEAMGIGLQPGDRHDIERYLVAVREQLDEATFDAAWAEGRAMSFEQAFSYALEVGQLVRAAPSPGPVREPEVTVELPAFLEGEEDKVPRPVFVARERELTQLDGYLNTALAGQGQVVFVTGEAGQGKTALVQEFARRAQAAHPDLIVAGGNGNAYTGVGDPYLPFREILGLLTGDVQDRWAARAISQEQARRLWHILPLAVQALVEAGPDLIDLFVPGPALTRRAEAFTPWPGRAEWLPRLEELVQRRATSPGDPNLQQSALFEQYTQVLGVLAGQRPLLLLLDDLQWVDGGSTNLFFHLGRRIEGGRILILGAYRPAEVALGRLTSPLRAGGIEGGRERHPLEPVVNEFRRHFGGIEVDLEQAEDRRFVEALLDSEPNQLGDTFHENLYRQTRGHPLSTVELLRDMQERGDLVQDEEGRWVEGPALEWETLPARVEAVIAERIGRLAEPAREALRVASVEGETFTAEVLARVLGASEREVVRQLSKLDREHRLVGAQGIRRLGPALPAPACPGGQARGAQAQVSEAKGGQRLSLYRFRHILFQRYLYNSLGEGERAYLHEDVGTALVNLYGEGTEEMALQLARHFQEAGIAGKAVGYLGQAGDRARGLYAHPEAIDCYRRALALLKELGEHQQAARVLMKMGLTHHNAFDFRAARQAYEESFALWQRAGEMPPAIPPPPAPHALRVAAFEPSTLDPGRCHDRDSGIAIGQLFSGLVELSPETDVLPGMACSWEVSEGGRKYVFHLQDDVRWSDGAPVTAEDFAYAWKRVLDPVTGSRNASLLYDVKGARAFHLGQDGVGGLGVQALDEATLVVELEEPTGYFLTLLTYAIAFPVPRHAVQVHGTAWTELGNIVTNGPFRLATWERGGSMVLERDPAYHGRFAGNVSRIELSFTSRDSARLLQMYEDDRLDAVPDVCVLAAEMDRARQKHAGDYVSVPDLGISYVGFAADRPPFDDRRVRRAFTLATDRETLSDVAGGGYRFPAMGGFVPPGMPGHSPGIGLPYDPEAGRRLLAEAGYPGGRGFPTIGALAPHRPSALPIVAYLKAQWLENLGIEVTWKQMEWGRFLDRLSAETPDVWYMAWLADYPDPDSFLRCSTWRGYTNWQDEIYDGLVEGARQVTNQEERMRMYRQADRILVEEAPVLPCQYGRIILLVKPWLSRFPTSATGWWFWKDVVIEPH
jgi:ABC-type oligopeptide transport system substrate-binding subunit